MAVKKNTEMAILTAFAEMIEAGIPVEEFDPTEKGDHIEFYFKFSKPLTRKQKERAVEIASKYIDADWSIT
jgi:hypothetical protein